MKNGCKLLFWLLCKESKQDQNILSPYDKRVVSKVAICDKVDANTILDIAKKASLVAKNIPLHQRINWLLDVAQKLELSREEMAQTITDEVGKPIFLHALKWIDVSKRLNSPPMLSYM